MDKDWMMADRRSATYELGVNEFIEVALKSGCDMNRMPCPCVQCLNGNWLPVRIVKEHLFFKGIDITYTTWTEHGEFDSDGEGLSEMQDTHMGEGEGEGEGASEGVDLDYDVEFSSDSSDFFQFVSNGDKPLYKGSDRTKLNAIVQSYNLKAKYSMSDKCYNDMLLMITQWLPESNECPSAYEAKKTLSALGMDYVRIHACPNDCILYREGNADASSCPTCGTSRWKVGKNKRLRVGIPAKVLWYFPLIPRFRKMFQSPTTAEILTWHSNERVEDGKMRHPADSPTWKNFDIKWPEFAKEPRNLRLALSSDGFNPFSNAKSTYSCWPVILVTYNLPPWLCMKRKFMMLTLLISGPKQPGNDIDVYLQPLVDDFKILWKGVERVYDAYRGEYFLLRACLFWTINDYPAYGNLSGCIVKGYNGCPICRENTKPTRLGHSGKVSYIGIRRWLPQNHRYRTNLKNFNGYPETEPAPVPLTGEEVLDRVKDIKCKFGKMVKKPTFKGKKCEVRPCWKKKSVFFELEYWSYIDVRHNLDVMHIEKNTAEALLGTLLNIPGKTKDTTAARLDMMEMNIRPELEPKTTGQKLKLPLGSCNLNIEEKRAVCKSLEGVKLAKNICSNVKSLVSPSDLKLIGLKSHDCHIIMQHLLPIAIRSSLHKQVREAIIRLCLFFKAICCKVIDPKKLKAMQDELVLVTCELEKYFPPSFFDIMIHLSVHLVREVELCGPVFFRWMYPFERYMKVFKGYIRNRNRPEGCIAEAYIAEEALEFLAEKMLDETTVGVPQTGRFDVSDRSRPLSGAKMMKVTQTELHLAHLCVLQNLNETRTYFDEHMAFLRSRWTKKSETWLVKKQNDTFPDWLKKKVSRELNNVNNNIPETFQWIADGPSEYVPTFHAYKINGVQFSTKERDDVRVVQCSGVSLEAQAMQVSSAKDKNPITGSMKFYGVIKEIWELDYHHHRVPLFKCDWVENDKGIKTDSLGYTLVNLNRIGHTGDPFVLGSYVKQVCYIDEPGNDEWSVVFHCPPIDYYYYGSDDDDEYAVLVSQEEDARMPAMGDAPEDETASYKRDGDEMLEPAM